MAKFEGNYPDEPKDAPKWFSPFHKNFGLVVKFLNAAGRRGLNLNDNILNIVTGNRVPNNFPVVFQHNLGVTPVAVLPQGGRYSYFIINSSDKLATTITFKLVSSPSVGPDYSTIPFVDVQDASMFKVGDSVTIGNQTRTITNINGNRISLDQAIRLTNPTVVFLNSESINVVFL